LKGAGIIAIQLAQSWGAKVITTAHSEEEKLFLEGFQMEIGSCDFEESCNGIPPSLLELLKNFADPLFCCLLMQTLSFFDSLNISLCV
jgi:hypothetical protein